MSTEVEFDPWKTTSGLPLADADAEITSVEFVTDNTIGAGVVVAKVTFDLGEGEVGEQKYSVGSGWKVTDRGNSVEPERGGNRGFNNQTNWGIFIDHAIKAADASGMLNELRSAVDPRLGSSWVGVKGHVVEYKRMVKKGKDSDEMKESTTFVFGELHGIGGGEAGEGASSAPAAKATGGAAKAAAPAAKAGGAKKGAAKPANSLTDEQRAQLVAIAESVIEEAGDDYNAFMEKALADDAVASSAAMTKAVMTDGDGSVWAEAKSHFTWEG
jgi:hypothetical protein